ncbi:hypothetical protein K501DRAFT_279660 [Backusella circina FSU 941]|nr:hypothetical protein K501DRAFT_279660 [Backusella circina FSU 941]
MFDKFKSTNKSQTASKTPPTNNKPKSRTYSTFHINKTLKKKNPNFSCFQTSEKLHTISSPKNNTPTLSRFRLDSSQHPVDKVLKKNNPNLGCYELRDGQHSRAAETSQKSTYSVLASDPKPKGTACSTNKFLNPKTIDIKKIIMLEFGWK